MILYRIRHIESGLFWNGARWAALQGTLVETNVVSLDKERELVALCDTAKKEPLKPGDRVRVPADASEKHFDKRFRRATGKIVDYLGDTARVWVEFDNNSDPYVCSQEWNCPLEGLVAE
jgi:ribosomal protein L21E